MAEEKEIEWSRIISAKSAGVRLGLGAVWTYRDLVLLFTRRDLVSIYKQTILGPLWLVLQPLLTSLVFMVVFGSMNKNGIGGYPHFIFYYSGLLFWALFSETFQKTADTFVNNADLFSKVFFPRLVIPFSVALTALFKFSFSLLVFTFIWLYYVYTGKLELQSYLPLVLIPVFCLITVILGMSFGLFFCALTTRYRDFRFLLQFGVQLLMYLSPIIFPLAVVGGTLKQLVQLNPMTGVIEASRSIFLDGAMPDVGLTLLTLTIMVVTFFLGLFVFSKVQHNFIDTI